jgi:hypothetical protein
LGEGGRPTIVAEGQVKEVVVIADVGDSYRVSDGRARYASLGIIPGEVAPVEAVDRRRMGSSVIGRILVGAIAAIITDYGRVFQLSYAENQRIVCTEGKINAAADVVVR